MSCACGKGSCNCAPPQMIHMADEEGVLHEFYVADRLWIENVQYAFLVSTEDQEQVAMLRVEIDESGREIFSNIENEQEWACIERELFGNAH